MHWRMRRVYSNGIHSDLRCRRQRIRRKRSAGFTLVELLVTMAVTLVLIFAMAQAFALIGDAVAEGRTTIEMAGNLRMVSNRLQQDFQGITVPVRPAPEDGAGAGYFEVLDGLSSDKDFDGNGIYEVDEDRDGDGNPDVLQAIPPAEGVTTRLGDVDDVVAFTTRNAKSPFIGLAYLTPVSLGVTPQVVLSAACTSRVFDSTLAEVVWWIQFEDLPDITGTYNGIYDVGEPFQIYRRAMPIRPDLISLPSRQLSLGTKANGQNGEADFSFGDGVNITVYPNGMIECVFPDLATLAQDMANFFNENDVSVRIERLTPPATVPVRLRLVCNSLADLTNRENRFAHTTILSDQPAPALPPVAAAGNYAALPAAGFPSRLDTNRRSVTSLYRSPKHSSNIGEDVMVSDALAFDVQVFDPQVPIIASTTSGEALIPSDPGYYPEILAVQNPIPANPLALTARVGNGAFVDIGYGRRETATFGNTVAQWPTPFCTQPQFKSGLYTPVTNLPIFDFCTWSHHYEHNGVDDDGDNRIDQGTNGFDDPVGGNYEYGVDDIRERETLPPYPVPLRGIQIRIRAIDSDSRKVRQVTVVSDFVPE